MRVTGMKKEEGWAGLEFRTTFRMGWERCLSVARVIWDYTDNAEIRVGDFGQRPEVVEVTKSDDFEKIQEAGYIEVRGRSKVYDNTLSQYIIYNQSDIVRMWMPTQYVEGLRKSETEYLNEEEQLHTFDKYMDSIEVNAEIVRAQKAGAQQAIKELKAALLQYGDFEATGSQSNEPLMYRGCGVEANLTEIVNAIRGIGK